MVYDGEDCNDGDVYEFLAFSSSCLDASSTYASGYIYGTCVSDSDASYTDLVLMQCTEDTCSQNCTSDVWEIAQEDCYNYGNGLSDRLICYVPASGDSNSHGINAGSYQSLYDSAMLLLAAFALTLM